MLLRKSKKNSNTGNSYNLCTIANVKFRNVTYVTCVLPFIGFKVSFFFLFTFSDNSFTREKNSQKKKCKLLKIKILVKIVTLKMEFF